MSEKDTKDSRSSKARKSRTVSSWWTRQRVENGLRRLQRDFFDGRDEALPLTIAAYNGAIPSDDKARQPREKIYPPGEAVLYHFESLTQAWWMLGFTGIAKPEPRKKYFLDERTEILLRETYSLPFKSKAREEKGLRSIQEISDELKMPKHVLIKFAAELGLTRTREASWSEDEVKIIDEQGYKTSASLVNIFRAAGFKRTEVEIQSMRARRMSHKSTPFFSLSAVAVLFGIDVHRVIDWVESGWLKAERKGTRRAAGNQGKGDTRVTAKDSIFRFIVEHPDAFELRYVDQLWFLHVVTRGEVEFIRSSRLSARSEAQLRANPVEKRK